MTPKIMIEWAGIVGLIIVLLQCIKLYRKIPGPFYVIIGIVLAIPLGLLNVYLPVKLPPLAFYGVQSAVVAVLVAFGVVSIGQKMFEQKTDPINPDVPPVSPDKSIQ